MLLLRKCTGFLFVKIQPVAKFKVYLLKSFDLLQKILHCFQAFKIDIKVPVQAYHLFEFPQVVTMYVLSFFYSHYFQQPAFRQGTYKSSLHFIPGAYLIGAYKFF